MAVDIGKLCDALAKIGDEIDKQNSKLKLLTDKKRELESELILVFDDANTDIGRGKLATVSISTTVRPQLKDFALLEPFVYRKKALHLFERRIAAVAYREMKETLGGKMLPGIEEFSQRRLNIRGIK